MPRERIELPCLRLQCNALAAKPPRLIHLIPYGLYKVKNLSTFQLFLYLKYLYLNPLEKDRVELSYL